MQPRYSARFPVHSYDVDAFLTLGLPALAGYLQEVAAQHASSLGWGLQTLADRGLAWVLARQRVEAPQAIALGDELEIATWPSGVDRLFATRELVVTRQDGTEVARSSTAWLLLDVASRRPVRPDQLIPLELRPRGEAVAALSARLPEPAPGGAERTFHVRYQDIDVNRHVTNTSYVAWALECISEERWGTRRPSSLEAHYLAEGRLGDVVVGRVAELGDELQHALVRERDGKELARLRTRWVARDEGRPR